MTVDLTSADALIAWYRASAPSGLPDGTPAWVAIGWACDRSPAAVPVAMAAAGQILDAGSDIERSEWLSVIVDRDDRLTQDLVTQLPVWADHPDPLQPGLPLGRKIVAAALAGWVRRHAGGPAQVEPLVARFQAWDDWLRLWVTTDPNGRGLDLLRAHAQSGRSLAATAGLLGVVYGAEAPASLLAAAEWVASSDLATRDRFCRAAEAHLAPANCALAAPLRQRLGL